MTVAYPSNPSGTASSTRVPVDSTHHEAEEEAAVSSDDQPAVTSGPDASVPPSLQRDFETLSQHTSCSQNQQDPSSMSLIGLLTNGLTHPSWEILGPVFSITDEVGYASNAPGLHTTATDGGVSHEAPEHLSGGRHPAAESTNRRRLRNDANRRRAVRRRVMLVIDEVLDVLDDGPMDFLPR
jgi:hypothetical protein